MRCWEGVGGRRETRAFVQAGNDAGVLGASLWHYRRYGPEDWQEMRLVGATSPG
jgi:hypothetical protein